MRLRDFQFRFAEARPRRKFRGVISGKQASRDLDEDRENGLHEGGVRHKPLTGYCSVKKQAPPSRQVKGRSGINDQVLLEGYRSPKASSSLPESPHARYRFQTAYRLDRD